MESVTNLEAETIDQLQDLIRINIDSSKGFETAAEKVDNAPIADYFRECARTRRRFADDLAQFIEMNDEDPLDDGSVRGALHRWWVGVRGSLQGGDTHALLAEAERGEDAIKHAYEKVIVKVTGNPINDVLHAQHRSVKQTHDRVRDLRDATA